ncbi:MarR family transcriptional regulator [Paraburkholderia sp. SIMBA_049]
MTYILTDRFVREHNLAVLLRTACDSIRNQLDVALSAHDVNFHQMSMLVAVSNGAARSPAEISRLLRVDPAVVTRALDRLEVRNLIERLRNQTDRRTVHVLLTPTGEQIVAQLCEIASRVLGGKLDRFSKIELEKLEDLLLKLMTD